MICLRVTGADAWQLWQGFDVPEQGCRCPAVNGVKFMAILRPFRGWRPRPELAGQVASPPYDVLDAQQARRLAEGNPISFVHVIRAEVDLDPSIDPHDPLVYATAARNLGRMMNEGILTRDAAPSFYVYQQKLGDHVQAGVMGAASADEYLADKIKKHELTRRDKEDDRKCHVEATNANTGPVFLTYKARRYIDEIVNRIRSGAPDINFVADDGVEHTLWVVDDDKVISRLTGLFARIPHLYVADGHHRSAAAWRLWKERKAQNPRHTGREEYNFFLTVIFPDNQMNIMPYNRVVKDLNGLSGDEFLRKISAKFLVSPNGPDQPGGNGKFSMYLGGRWYLLKARPGSFDASDPVKRLDASILQDNLLGSILGIVDPRTDKRINFVGGIKGTKELMRLVDSGQYAVAFSLHPVSMRQLLSVADSGQVMPPKSTWFEPKLKSGLFVHEYD